MSDRYCVAGCGTSLAGRRSHAKWCSEACRLWTYHNPGRPARCICRYCGASIVRRWVAFCSDVCRRHYAKPPRTNRYRCNECSCEFWRQVGATTRSGRVFCSETCQVRNYWRRPTAKAHWGARRARKVAAFDELVRCDVVADRDKWQCHLCGKYINPNAAWPDGQSLSMDHVVPLSVGGRHSYANIRAAHLRCNLSKNARAQGEQLMMIGTV